MDRSRALPQLDYRIQRINELQAKHRSLKANRNKVLPKALPPRPTISVPQTQVSPLPAVPPITSILTTPIVSATPPLTTQTVTPPQVLVTPKFFYINLDRATERRERMEQQLTDRGINFERVVAVDANAGPNVLFPFVPVNWRGGMLNAFKAEIATTISHLKAIHQFVQSQEPVGIIVEDDAVFEYESKWPYTLVEVINGAPKGWEILTLSITTSDNALYDGIMRARKRYHHRKSNFYSAVAYAITRQHAINLLSGRYQCDVNSSTFGCKLSGNVAQMQSEINVLGVGPHRYFLYPPAFTYPTDNNSYIHPHHIQGHKNCKAVVSRAYDENDPLYFMP
jgi:hypothetical protein